MLSVRKFTTKHRLRVYKITQMLDRPDRWSVILKAGGRNDRRRVTVMVTRPKEPTLSDVLAELVRDAQEILHTQGFADWASVNGYNPDSVTMRDCYHAATVQTTRVNRFLGDEAFLELVNQAAV